MKGAIEVLSVYMARELGSRGIAVNCVAPGAIETDFLGGAVRDMPELNASFAGMTALGRVGVPDDIGPMIASLLSESNRWVFLGHAYQPARREKHDRPLPGTGFKQDDGNGLSNHTTLEKPGNRYMILEKPFGTTQSCPLETCSPTSRCP